MSCPNSEEDPVIVLRVSAIVAFKFEPNWGTFAHAYTPGRADKQEGNVASHLSNLLFPSVFLCISQDEVNQIVTSNVRLRQVKQMCKFLQTPLYLINY